MSKKKFFLLTVIFSFLSVHTFNAQSKNTENKRIKSLINKKRAYNREFGYGFRIQLFNGLEARAKKIKNQFAVENPNTKIYLRYFKPEWKVRIGNYKTNLEADKALNMFKEDYPGAIIVPL